MKLPRKWLMAWMTLAALLLPACSPAAVTQTTPTANPTAVSGEAATAAPALRPVTPTPEEGFATGQAEADRPEAAATKEATERPAETIADGVVLVFERAGGLKGIGPSQWRWTFYADGRIEGSDGRSWEVDPAEIAALLDALAALNFADFRASYAPADLCCDLVTHTITLQLDGQVVKTAVTDNADAPPELFTAVDLINQFLLNLPT